MVRSLLEVLWVFAQIGVTSFGGAAASIAVMQRVVVHKLGWLSRREFLDFAAASYLIPGPIAVQLSLHLGYRRAGLWGACAAVAGFVGSAAAITWLCAVLYVRNQGLPQWDACLQGVRPAILAVILMSLGELAKGVVHGPRDLVLTVGTAIGFLAGGNPFLVLIAAALAGTVAKRIFPGPPIAGPREDGTIADGEAEQDEQSDRERHAGMSIILPPTLISLAPAAVAPSLGFLGMFLAFAKIGLFLYGGGNVIAAYLSNDFVKTGILTHQQLLDALAVGQSTPGPILTVATFIGYLLGGHLGAVAATAGLITPCVLLASLLHSWVRKIRRQTWAAGLFEALSAAVLGLILGVWLDLARQVFTQPLPTLLCAACLILLWRCKVSPVQVVFASALTGLLLWG